MGMGCSGRSFAVAGSRRGKPLKSRVANFLEKKGLVIAKAMNQWGEGFPTSRCSYNQTPQERCLTKRQTKLQCAAVAQQVIARASQGSRPSKV